MTTMLSLILALMLSIGGTPAGGVNPAGGPGNTGIQAPIDNGCSINRIFEDYSQKTASRLFSKKTLETPLINRSKTQIRLNFELCLKEKLLLRGYIDSMNLYQAFNMNPINFTDPMGTVLNLKFLIDIYGSVKNAENVVKSVYSQLRLAGDTHSVAYKKLIDYKFVIDTGSIDDIIYEEGLAVLPSLGVFDVTPGQFGKDLAGGVSSAITNLGGVVAKGLPGGSNPYVSEQIDKAQNWAQSNINTAIGANEGSLGYWIGETYAPAIAGGWLSAELELANATAQTGKTLPLFVEGQAPAEAGFGNLSQAQEYGIKPYNQLKQSTKGTDLQSHHLIEKRFERTLNIKKGQMKAIAVTKPEHQVFTNAWRNLIPYGKGTLRATPEEILESAKAIYKNYTTILKALGL